MPSTPVCPSLPLSSRDRLIEAFGWYGAAAILAAYAFVSLSILQPTDLWYQILNGTGALGIISASLKRRAYQPAVLNAVWATIALFAIIRLLAA